MSSTAHKLPPVLYVVGDESGSFYKGDWMVVGLVLLSDPPSRRRELAALRGKHPYAHELKYGSTDKLRMPYALAVLAWFFETPDVEFRCIAKSGDEFDLSYFNYEWRGLNPETLAYNYTYREILQNALPAEPRRVLVKVDEKSRHRQDNLLDYLRAKVPSVRQVNEADSKSDDLLQVVDLLTGCVHGDLMGTRDSLKRSLSDEFLRRCGCSSVLERPSKCSHAKVNVWRWRSTRKEERAADRS
jgi:hypothetical protein